MGTRVKDMKKASHFLFLLLVAAFFSSKVCCIVLDVDYETGTLDGGYSEVETHPPLPERAGIEEKITRNSSYAAYHELHVSDPSVAASKRCESDSMKLLDARIKHLEEVYYGFTFYIPSTWEFDDDFDDILVQWKGFDGGPFMFITQKHKGLFLRVNANTDPDVGEDNMIKLQYVITKNVAKGMWHDFKVRVIWDWMVDGFGLVQMDYKTEHDRTYEQVISIDGPNMSNRDGYLKWGIYKPAWQTDLEFNVTMRKIWHDNIRIGSTWDEVDPDLLT